MVSWSSIADYYKELGINRYATSTDIRTAYKRLALIWHPDRNKAKDAEEKFKRIKQAHDVLIDDNRRRQYDQQQVQQQNTWFATTTNINVTRPNQDSFNLHTFDQFTATPLDPFDILNDIQFFQESNFTSKMMNSPGYRNLYTELFNTMNNPNDTNPHIHSTGPIYLDNDRLFRSVPPKPRCKPRPTTKRSPINIIPTINHSTMANDRFLNELLDLYEEQNYLYRQPSSNYDPFFDDLSYCESCQKQISNDRTYSTRHGQQCQPRNNNNRYSTISSKSVRV